MRVAATYPLTDPVRVGGSDAAFDRLDAIGVIRHLAPHESLVLEGDSAKRIHRVLSGTIAGYNPSHDGGGPIRVPIKGDLVTGPQRRNAPPSVVLASAGRTQLSRSSGTIAGITRRRRMGAGRSSRSSSRAIWWGPPSANTTPTVPKPSTGQVFARSPARVCENSLGNRRRYTKTFSWLLIERSPPLRSGCCGSDARRRGSGWPASCWNTPTAPERLERTAARPFRYR